MRLTSYNHFLTLVVALSFVVFLHKVEAAPESSITPAPIDTKPVQPRVVPQPNSQLDSMEISDPPDKDYRSTMKAFENWYFDRSINVTVGYAAGVFDTTEEHEETWVLGIQRTNYNSEDTAQEYGIEFTRLDLLGVNWGFKWLCCYGANYEPFYKLGIAAFYDPEDKLANFINFERYLLRGSVGLENLFNLRRRLRAEATVGVGPQGFTFGSNLIYVIPD